MQRILRRLRPYLQTHRNAFILAVVAMVGFDLLTQAIPLAIGYVTDYVYPNINEPGIMRVLFLVCGAVLVVGLTRGVLIHLMVRNYWRLAESVVRDLRNTVYEKLQHLPLSFYDRARTGDLMSRVTYDIQVIRNFLAFGIEHRIRIILISVTVFSLMLYQDWRLALAVFVIVPIFFATVLHFSRRMRTAVLRQQRQMGRLNARIQENLTGIRVVKAFSAEQREKELFERENQEMLDKDLGVSLLQVYLNPILLVSDGVGALIILLFGGWQVIQGTMSLGVLLAFVAYMNIMRFPITILALNTSMVTMAEGASTRIQEILDTPDQKRVDLGTRTDPIEGQLTFDHVGFNYDEREAVLKDVSFSTEPGEHVALFGLTGAGKSTLISLIPRFYLPTEGTICIDGKPITEWKLPYLRSQIGTVLQETFLFSATIAENIAFARPDASREDVREAARHAQIDEFISQLPDGYETIVGEYGVGLSGGQKQRVAIARTILQDPRLLILDDCTSSLDAATEHKIQNQLRELMVGRTTIIIAQRVATLALADRIIVLNEGRIADIDSHEVLMERNELYRTTYLAQTVARGTPINESWG
ncbi:MAG: ABC transporter ATP-binding protein [Spirochaetota bacterium]